MIVLFEQHFLRYIEKTLLITCEHPNLSGSIDKCIDWPFKRGFPGDLNVNLFLLIAFC